MARGLAPQTPRRSRRFQPLATPFLQRQTTKTECSWEGGALHARPCNPDFDLMQEERDGREQEEVEGEKGVQEPQDQEETVFYTQFTMKRPRVKPLRGKQLASGEEVLTFRVGDAITVETDTLYRQRRPPSVAVIVSMWEVKKMGDDAAECDSSKMRLRVHWFLRPSELAAIREKRDHEENEIYYSLTSSDILVPSVIVDRCAVSGDRIAGTSKGKAKEELSCNPVKTIRTPGKKGSSSKAPAPDSDFDEEGESELPSIAPNPEETFYCRYAINSQRGLYYNLKWDRHRDTALKTSSAIPEEGAIRADWGTGKEWNVDTSESVTRAKKSGPPPKKRMKVENGGEDLSGEDVDSGSEAEFDSEQDEDDDTDGAEESEGGLEIDDDGGADGFEPLTPSKSQKRKRGQTDPKSPRKRKANIAQPTPHSKQAIRKRRKLKGAVNGTPRKAKAGKFLVRQPTLSFKTDMSRLPPDPWLRAMHVLHVGNRPEALPCRGAEYNRVFACVGELLEEGSGGCVYISGVPGTGKTATVHTVIGELKRMAQENEINPFTYVEINGLRIPEPAVAYTLLWEAISRQEGVKTDHRMSSNHSLKALTHHFGRPTRGPAQHSYVVLMDELDQLVTPKQDVIYNFFNWPTLANSRLIVVAVANTMDLPERVMTGRVRSRLGMTRINFEAYTTNQLVEIVEARLATIREGLDEENAKHEVITRDAIKYVAMSVCRITGDARRVLDACRRVVESVSLTKTIAKPPHATKVVKAMQSSPTAGYLQDCSLHERIMLASLIRCVRREGVEEIKWSDVQYQHLNYIGALTGPTDSQRKPSVAELTAVLDSLVASRAILLEDGPSVARKSPGERRLLLNIEHIEVERVLSDVGGQTWKNVLSA